MIIVFWTALYKPVCDMMFYAASDSHENMKLNVVVSMCIEEHLSRKHSNIANYIARA